jgi:Domain of unknown function (DUF4304)
MASSLDAEMSAAINRVLSLLVPLGFKKSGNLARLIADNNVAILAFQRSNDSTSKAIKFTINLGIVCGALLDPEGLSLAKARDVDGHLRQRIGAFLPDHPDKWWVIDESTNVQQLTKEIADLVVEKAAPFLLRYVKFDELLTLWQSGQSPGLTEGARVRYLDELIERGRKVT